MKQKYHVGDIFLIPHFNGHNLPAVITITGVEKRKYTTPEYKYSAICSDEYVPSFELFQEDIDIHLEEGEYIHYPVKK